MKAVFLASVVDPDKMNVLFVFFLHGAYASKSFDKFSGRGCYMSLVVLHSLSHTKA